MRPPKNVTSSFFANAFKSPGNFAPNIAVRVAKKYKIKHVSIDLLKRSETVLFSVFVMRLYMCVCVCVCVCVCIIYILCSKDIKLKDII